MKIDIESTRFYKSLQNKNSDLNNNQPFEFEKDLKSLINLPSFKLKDKIDEIESYLSLNFKSNLSCVKGFLKDKYEIAYEKLRDEVGILLAKEKRYFICPYCKANFISLVEAKSKTLKPDLDHFYPKSKYPYLATTFSNLIPSCTICNSRLKGDKTPQISIDNALNIVDRLKFKADLVTKTIYISNLNSFNDSQKEWLSQMMIEEIYNSHTEILDNLIAKFKKYKNSRLTQISQIIDGLTSTTIKNIVFAEYKLTNKDKEPLFKLKKDLYTQMK